MTTEAEAGRPTERHPSHHWTRPGSFTVDSPPDAQVCPVCGVCTCHHAALAAEKCTGVHG